MTHYENDPQQYDPPCIDLDYRFATVVSPDETAAAQLRAQDQCSNITDGQQCTFRLSSEGEPCRLVSQSMTALGKVTVRASENVKAREAEQGRQDPDRLA